MPEGWLFGIFPSFTLKLLKQPQMYLQNIKIQYFSLRPNVLQRNLDIFFVRFFLAYNSSCPTHVWESILTRQTTPHYIWGIISLVHFLIINALPES